MEAFHHMTKENDRLKGLLTGMEAFCFSCKKMGPFRLDGNAVVCERCGFHDRSNWTRKFRRMPEGLMPVREETKI